jgi:hypothetical protein
MTDYLTALRDEIKNRARIYYHIYRRLSAEIGEEKAIAVLKRALYDRGSEKGRQLAEKIGSPDLRQVAAAFVEGKQGIDVFGHEVVEVDDNHALLRLNQCPLVEAWKDLGLSPEGIKTMCDFAYQVDFGKFETAGYNLKFNRRIAEGNSSCDLKVEKR